MKKVLLAFIFVVAATMSAQSPRTDLALTFTADHTNTVYGTNPWLEGGSAELGANAWHGLGIAARVTGMTTSAMDSQAVPVAQYSE